MTMHHRSKGRLLFGLSAVSLVACAGLAGATLAQIDSSCERIVAARQANRDMWIAAIGQFPTVPEASILGVTLRSQLDISLPPLRCSWGAVRVDD